MDQGFGIDLPLTATIVIGAIVVGYFILITGFGPYFSRFSRDISIICWFCRTLTNVPAG